MSTQSDTALELYEEEMQALAASEEEQEGLEETREHYLYTCHLSSPPNTTRIFEILSITTLLPSCL